LNKIAYLNTLIANHTTLRDKELVLDEDGAHIGGNIHKTEEAIKKLENNLDDLTKRKSALNLQF
jgi:hypothetical protein